MTRREALAALVVLPAALLVVPPPMGKVAQSVVRVSASVAEFEREIAALGKKLAHLLAESEKALERSRQFAADMRALTQGRKRKP